MGDICRRETKVWRLDVSRGCVPPGPPPPQPVPSQVIPSGASREGVYGRGASEVVVLWVHSVNDSSCPFSMGGSFVNVREGIMGGTAILGS